MIYTEKDDIFWNFATSFVWPSDRTVSGGNGTGANDEMHVCKHEGIDLTILEYSQNKTKTHPHPFNRAKMVGFWQMNACLYDLLQQ